MKEKLIELNIIIILLGTVFIVSCNKEELDVNDNNGNGNVAPVENDTFDINSISDTYYNLASVENIYSWGVYNVHDPSIIKSGDTYYCYSTDVAFGESVKPGLQIRKSKDLIEWEFVGWVFNSIPSKGADYINSKGGIANNSLWAPYVIKVGDEYRLYYSLASNLGRLSCIGLATSSLPLGPWVEKDIVVRSVNNNQVHTNAIDPSVVVGKNGEHWFYYGSSWDGIYRLQLNPNTGLPISAGDKGERVAHRGFSNGIINGNIEGPEIIYNEILDKYFLFIAYDWLETKYNVRVGRSDNPEGPFYDFNGNNINEKTDNVPMILAPYKFNGHSGWQGVSHPSVFKNEKGEFFIAHQGRPGENKYFMILHVRQIHWTEDGWPIVSPQRFADIKQSEISNSDLVGNYEFIDFNYDIVPGFADEQLTPGFQNSISIELNENGTISGDENNTWSLNYPWLTLQWNNSRTDILYVEQGRDWENNVAKTILFSGLTNEGKTVWAKKIE